jgi:hypothetical protein
MFKNAICISFLIVNALINSCSSNIGYSNKLVSEIRSEHGLKAVIFYKGGDATVPDSYQVSLINVDEKEPEYGAGNIFTCKDNGEGTVSVKWISQDSLLIEYVKSTTYYIKESKAKGVNIIYKEN